MDLDQSGHGFQRTRTYLGPSLGWIDALVQQTTDVQTAGVYVVQPGDSLLLVEAAGSVTVQLPDVVQWVQSPNYQPATGFERSITVKDQGGNAGAFPITITPFAGQAIDNVFAPVQISVSRSSIRLYPLIDLTGWYVESSAVGGPPQNGDVFKAGNNTFTGINNFTNSILVPVLPAADDSNKAASTSFVKLQGYITSVSLNAYALKESPAFTGIPTAPTPGNASNDGTLATTAFVKSIVAGYQPLDDDLSAISALTGAPVIYYRSGAGAWSPVVIGANMSFTGGVLSSTGGGGTGDVTQAGNNTFTGTNAFNGTTTAVTEPAATNSTAVATTAFVKSQNYVTTATLSLYAPLGSPIFTGNPTGPTPSTGDNSTSLATTAYVKNNLNNYQPLDADLTAISNLAGTNVIYYRSAADTWSPVTIGANLTFAGGTLAATTGGGTVNSSGGGYSTSTLTGYADATGNVIRAVTTGNGISIAAGVLTLDADLQALAALTATNAIYYRSAADTWTTVTIGTGLIFSGGTLSASASGGGNVSNTGTPAAGQYARWTSPTVIQGVTPATVLTDIGAQPLDAGLTALAGLSTSAIYYLSAPDVWTPVTIGANLTFSGGTLSAAAGGIADAPNDGKTYARKSAAWVDLATGLPYVLKAGDTMTGALTLSMTNPAFYLTKPAGANGNFILGTVAGVPRWQMQLGDAAAEGAGTAGSDFSLMRCDNAGAILDYPIKVARADGVVTFVNSPIVPTAAALSNNTKAASTAYVDAAVAAGASSGFSTGDIKLTLKNVADSGWTMFNDGSIGDTGSGSSQTGAAFQALFTLLFNNINDTNCPIQTSTGAATNRATQGTAATAWANKCRMFLPKVLGRALAAAGSGAGLTSRALGATAGAETYTFSGGEHAAHQHTADYGGGTNHTHSFQGYSGLVSASYVTINGGSTYNVCLWGGSIGTVGYTTVPGSTGLQGNATPFNIVQPTSFLNVMVKL